MKRALAVVVVAAILGIAVGCTNAPPSVSRSTTAHEPGATVSKTDAPGKASQLEAPVPRPASWDAVRTWVRRDGGHSFGASTNRLAVLVAAPSTGRGYSTVETLSGHVLVRHDPGGGQWETQDGWLASRGAVFLDINLPRRIARLSVYSLPSGTRADWSGDGERSHVSPEAAADGDALAYFTGTPDEGMCLHSLDLATLKQLAHECGQKGEILGDPAIQDGSLTFTRLTDSDDPSARCKVINVLDLRTGAHDVAAEEAVAANADCLVWDGVTLGDEIAWEEADPLSPNVAVGHGYLRTTAGDLIDLGDMSTGTMVSCGGYLFWSTEVRDGQRVVQWRPGTLATVVMRPSPDLFLTTLQCTEDRWLTTRADDISGGRIEKLRLLTLDTSGQD